MLSIYNINFKYPYINVINIWSDLDKAVNYVNNIEALTVTKRANQLLTGFLLTDTQILRCLISLNFEQSNKGKLLQVATDEGKSTILCILAIINALKVLKSKINVITSSPVMEERDPKHKMKVYKMFALTCSYNNYTSVYLKGPKECYKADVV
jgi:preprotein translocase subunit SecA